MMDEVKTYKYKHIEFPTSHLNWEDYYLLYYFETKDPKNFKKIESFYFRRGYGYQIVGVEEEIHIRSPHHIRDILRNDKFQRWVIDNFDELPDDYICPECGAGKEDFVKLD